MDFFHCPQGQLNELCILMQEAAKACADPIKDKAASKGCIISSVEILMPGNAIASKLRNREVTSKKKTCIKAGTKMNF